jgi:palmitoyltransferase
VKKSRWKSIQAVFGRFSLSWFSPFSALPKHTKQHGYLFSV